MFGYVFGDLFWGLLVYWQFGGFRWFGVFRGEFGGFGGFRWWFVCCAGFPSGWLDLLLVVMRWSSLFVGCYGIDSARVGGLLVVLWLLGFCDVHAAFGF